MVRNRPAWRGLGPELRQYFVDRQWIAEATPLGAVGCTWHELAVDYELVSGTLLPPPPQWTEGRERGHLDSTGEGVIAAHRIGQGSNFLALV